VLVTIARFVLEEFDLVDDQSPAMMTAFALSNTIPYPRKLVLKTATPRYYIDRSRAINYEQRTPFYTTIKEKGNLSLTKNTTAILRLSKRFHKICAPVLYETYEFASFAAESFRIKFLPLIGKENAASIRRLRIGLPFGIKTEPSKNIGRYVRMLERDLPRLHLLQVTTVFGRWQWPVTHSPNNTWIESNRGLIWFASWLTRDHSSLKYAVWSEENTVNNNVLDDHYPLDGGWDDRKDVRLTVTFSEDRPVGLKIMEHPAEIQERNAQLFQDEDGKLEGAEIVQPASVGSQRTTAPRANVILQGILLDSYKIRRTGWSALGTKRSCRPYEYQLPGNASDSEGSRPATFTDALVECEEKYFHKKLLDLRLRYPERPLSRPVTDVLYLAALARNLINILEEESMFRGSPPTEFEIPEYEAEIVNEWGDDSAAGDQGSNQDAHAETEEDLTDEGSMPGEESNEYDATSEYEISEPEGVSELEDSEYESAHEYSYEDGNTPEHTTDEVSDNVHRWESDDEGCPW
jgi:hypothetical protein